jgi:hypothetical protein
VCACVVVKVHVLAVCCCRCFFSDGERSTLDPAPPRSAGGGASAVTLAAAVAAGEEADEDAEEGDDGVDDGVEDVADARDDGHDGVADGSEERLDARDDGTHFSGCGGC